MTSVKSATNSAIDERLKTLRLQVMASETAKRVGARIRQRREQMGLNQRQFAELFDDSSAVTNQHISNWERGINEPSERYMDELVRVTERDRAWFYSDPASDPSPDLMGALSEAQGLGADRLDRIEQKLDAVVEALTALASGELQAALLAAAQKVPAQQTQPGSDQASTGHRRQ